MSPYGWTMTRNRTTWLEVAKTSQNIAKQKNLKAEPLTGDHVSLFDDKLNIKELDEKITEMKA